MCVVTYFDIATTDLFSNLGSEPLGCDRLGALQWQSQRTVPVELAQTSDGTANAEQNGVVLELSESIVPQEDSRVTVHVGVGVGNLAVFLQNIGHDLVDGVDNLEQLIIGHVLEPEFALASVARIGLAQNGVSVSWNDLFGVEGVPSEFGDGVGVVTRLLYGTITATRGND